jgi:hypothetical protein
MPTFSRTIPLLVYDDIPAAHDFLVTPFGFEPGFIALRARAGGGGTSMVRRRCP